MKLTRHFWHQSLVSWGSDSSWKPTHVVATDQKPHPIGLECTIISINGNIIKKTLTEILIYSRKRVEQKIPIHVRLRGRPVFQTYQKPLID